MLPLLALFQRFRNPAVEVSLQSSPGTTVALLKSCFIIQSQAWRSQRRLQQPHHEFSSFAPLLCPHSFNRHFFAGNEEEAGGEQQKEEEEGKRAQCELSTVAARERLSVFVDSEFCFTSSAPIMLEQVKPMLIKTTETNA
ncbi:hypothetical protein DPX16_10403 [Anabarilius grahami]|uniref:Uncharacterized protein n=1 Tax=Anabarilius grahami TaxID=495550 RepID=A0A3N0Y592_ANAGA|nr:hypothetical protein DPX16_10403 [Anabarilius grahami]